MNSIIKTDITIIGAGIAGLWLANTLKKLGFSILLIEKNALGSFQTINSQGIIHGGMKYSLLGKISNTTSNISKMTNAWNSSFSNKISNEKNLINLSETKINSECHDLCFPNSSFFKVSSFVTSKVLSSKCKVINKNDKYFQTSLNKLGYNGIVYRITEKVVDTKSLLKNLSINIQENIIKLQDYKINYQNEHVKNIEFAHDNHNYTIESQIYIGTSGMDNQSIINLSKNLPAQQLRPLQMILAKPDVDLNLFAHFINKNNKDNKPFATVTTHQNSQNQNILYFGGKIAESEHYNTPKNVHIENAKKQIQKVLPKANVENWKWDTLKINRAEVEKKYNKMPDTSFAMKKNNLILGWPTKLTFAPGFAERVINILENANIKPYYSEEFTNRKFNLCTAQIAEPCWDKI